MKTIYIFLISCILFGSGFAHAGPYTDSAHGDAANGVNRTSTSEYCTGNCAHCHEQHASIGGEEPEPKGSCPEPPCAEKYLLFSKNYTDQTNCFCFDCHKGLGSYQSAAFYNYNYSYRASGDSSIICPDDILEAFSFINETGASVSNCNSFNGTSHKLTDIQTFIAVRWGYTANSNPCTACHDPHRTKKDPHTSTSRGWPVSRPSGHADTSTWQLWGDDPGEKMSAYYGTYQAPYRHNSTTTYEPDGSATQDGSNLTDYVTFCTDCHDNSNIIYSNVLNRNLYTIDWAIEKHGRGAAGDCCDDIQPPYQQGQCGGYILACTDCHEPHGAPNIFLTREKVNGGDVTVLTGTGEGPGGMPSASEWVYLCGKCHGRLSNNDGHAHPTYLPQDPPMSGDPPEPTCSQSHCHDMSGVIYRPCAECHYHGNRYIDGVDYGEPLF